ncbi:RNA polymerase subunit sigma-70 [Sphaerisporangium album]|uniref:RNA polymerase subunit sigma-70 n=1 Tax=Sphaerisporangium album TaxID=509200 RepID=A0A367FJ10_9ACTN|nr:RNA polymerase subunit sigma-70 [Sphaerisporangium album]
MSNSWSVAGLSPPGSADTVNPTRAAADQRERPSPESDELRRVVLRAKTGDADAFAALYDRYVDLVYRYVYFRVGCHMLAEDLTSETFLRALGRIGHFTWQGRDVGAWLVTIARNLVTDHYKSGRYRMEVSTAEVLDTPLDGAHIPENAVVATMITERVLRAVRDLGPEQQECVVLRFLHGMSLAETALIMGKKSGAIKALQFRAIRALARALPDDLN